LLLLGVAVSVALASGVGLLAQAPVTKPSQTAESGSSAAGAARSTEVSGHHEQDHETGYRGKPWAEVALGPVQTERGPDLMLAPPDGEWLADDKGEFIVSRWPKVEGTFKWIDESAGRLRLNHLPPMQAVAHDDSYFYFRIEKPTAIEPPAGPSEEDLRAIEQSYRFDVPEVDEVRLVPWADGLPESGQWRNGFAIADMNGDGHLDLVHPPARKSFRGPVIFLGDGAGHWRYWQEARFPDLPYDYGDVATGDLDGDGHQDLVLAIHVTGLIALRGDGTGGFTDWSEGLPMRESARRRGTRPRPTNWSPDRRGPGKPEGAAPAHPLDVASVDGFSSRAVALADWNGDGRLDILALSEGPTSVDSLARGESAPRGKLIFLNAGDGTWKPLTGPGEMLGDVVLPIDLDGDGRLDFVTDSAVVGSAAILNYGTEANTESGWETILLSEPRRRLLVSAVAVADFDGDGRLDVAAAFQARELDDVLRYGIDIHFGQPERRFRRESVLALLPEESRGLGWLSAGDVDGDGDADLVALGHQGDVLILLNQGAGEFAVERTPEGEPDAEHGDCSGYRAALRDLDGDGRNELVAVFAGEPGSEILLTGAIPTRCRANGAIRVWKIDPGPGALDSTAVGRQDSPPSSS
jgi:hypothetical protein